MTLDSSPTGIANKTRVNDVGPNLQAFFDACRTHKEKGVGWAGTFRSAQQLSINFGSGTNSNGVCVEFEGRGLSRIWFDETVASPNFFFGCDPGGTLVNSAIRGLGLLGTSPNGITAQFGRPDFSDALNECELWDMYIVNGDLATPYSIGCQLNHMLNLIFSSICNGGGFTEATRQGRGYAALDVRGVRMSTLMGSWGNSCNGLMIRDGAVTGNVFQAPDIEAATTLVYSAGAGFRNNVFNSGRYALGTYGFNMAAGYNNVAIRPDMDTLTVPVPNTVGFAIA